MTTINRLLTSIVLLFGLSFAAFADTATGLDNTRLFQTEAAPSEEAGTDAGTDAGTETKKKKAEEEPDC